MTVSQVSVCWNRHWVARGIWRGRCRMEVVRARADVDVVLRRERGARGGPVSGVTGGVCRLRRRQIVAHVAVMMVVGGQGNRLHGFITR